MCLQVFLRLPPRLLTDDGGDWPGDNRSLAGGPLAELVDPHVGLIGDQPSNPARAPHSGGPFLPLAAGHEAVVANVGTWDAQAVQSLRNYTTRLLLYRRHPEYFANDLGL